MNLTWQVVLSLSYQNRTVNLYSKCVYVNSFTVQNWEYVMIPATPSVRSDLGLAVAVGRAWNLVPAEIRQSRILGSFKRQMKSFLLKVSYG